MADNFTKTYKRLNPEQKRAVDTIEGPVMVVAGPGTGKTQVLTLRIANILRKTDTAPSSILALTFTESAVVSMRRRLAELIGSPAYAVTITTFHSFCNEVIKNEPEAFPRIIGAVSITDVDQIGILEQAIQALELDILRPFGDPIFYVKPMLNAIRKLKQEGITPDAFDVIVADDRKIFDALEDKVHEKGKHKGIMKGEYQKQEKRLKKAEELTCIFRFYEEQLANERLYDYEDMIYEVVRELDSNKELLLLLQEQYQYLLVDEHQDTNNSQNKLLELLASFHETPNLFVVGDQKQAIFRFQGASLENFIYFKDLYKNAELIVLADNYRSSSSVLDAAEGLISGERELIPKAGHTPRRVEVATFSSDSTEAFGVAKEISAQLESGTQLQEIAVLYRDNRDAFPIADMLERFSIPFVIESAQDVLQDPDIRKLVVLMRAVASFGDDSAFIRALHIDFLEVHPLDIALLLRARQNKKPIFSVVKSERALEELGCENGEAVHSAYRKIATWSRLSMNGSLPDTVEVLIRDSGFLSHLLAQDDPIDKLDKLSGFFAEMVKLVERKRDAGIPEFLEYLEKLEAHKILIRSASASTLKKRVRLMTAHRSKGLEFKSVIIVNAYDGHWGNKRRRELLPLPVSVYRLSEGADEGSSLDDERRLFYVALTRAKERMLVTYAKEGVDGRERLPSVFLEEIGAEILEKRDTSQIEEDFLSARDIVFAPKIRAGAELKDEAFIKELFQKNGLSVTALNNYLICPWRYFYRNLLRVPEAPARHQMLGIAVHEALKSYFDAMADIGRATKPDKAFLLTHFEHELMRQPLSEKEFKDALKRGNENLGGYVDKYGGTWIDTTINEFSISGVLLDEIRLTGKIDKLEILEDNAVNVVDYKTGKPKSRNHIEGNTKTSDGGIKRQLVFYNVLLNRYEEGKYQMRSGEIDFVEPDVRGNYKKERFEIVPEEVVELEGAIRDVSAQILSLSFWDKRCEDKKCEYCELREMLG